MFLHVVVCRLVSPFVCLFVYDASFLFDFFFLKEKKKKIPPAAVVGIFSAAAALTGGRCQDIM